jgi:hypothetical protein
VRKWGGKEEEEEEECNMYELLGFDNYCDFRRSVSIGGGISHVAEIEKRRCLIHGRSKLVDIE